MKAIIIALVAIATATAAYAASCTSQTITVNGKIQYCTKCCDDAGNCQWNCSN